MTDLTDRQLQILKAIIEEFIETAEPVASETLDKKYNLGISPATIRNEMVKLTSSGFLKQPHTSAGRSPTPMGLKFFVDKLISMGARIVLVDPHRVLISGPSKLKGRVLETPDIRAGMALVLASLVAKGKSLINQSELIERGYEDVVGKLKNLGAEIERIET